MGFEAAPPDSSAPQPVAPPLPEVRSGGTSSPRPHREHIKASSPPAAPSHNLGMANSQRGRTLDSVQHRAVHLAHYRWPDLRHYYYAAFVV